MIRVGLPPTAVARLGEVLRATAETGCQHRVQTVLTAHRGRPHGLIAAAPGYSRGPARRLGARLERGLDGPTPRGAPGAEPGPTPDLAPVLKPRAMGGPAEHRLGRADRTGRTPNWPAACSGPATSGCGGRPPTDVRGEARHPPVQARAGSPGATRPSGRRPGGSPPSKKR